MILLLTTFLVGLGSALLPFINIEIYLAGVAGADGAGGLDGWRAVAISSVAAVGQTIGKIVWFEVAKRGMTSAWAQRRLSKPKTRASYEKWSGRMQGRPWYAGVIIFVSASAGVPPLLAMAVVAGALRMPLAVFVPTVLLGRALRFYLILVGVDFAFH